MRQSPRNRQCGYVLLIMLLALMGIGGVVAVGYTQGVKKDAEHFRYLHNKRVLKEAKQALLQYAYNYPVTAGFGPGRLPCPDTNNTGTPNPSAFCINGNALVGRLPWRDSDLNFYDARDASGERLWYAVSSNFANNGPASINSDTSGTITIHDQTGALVYDGLGAGVAAVIIAPGPPIDRNGVLQDRRVTNGIDDPEGIVADNDPGIVDPVNYLDLFGALDNADFINGNSGDGFVLGPIDDLAAEELIVNDQMVVITAEEVLAMAEKATLQAYRNAIEAYQINTGVNRYPWLDPYSSTDGLGTFDAVITAATPVSGRLPSIFANYFDTNTADSQPIVSELVMTVTVDGDQYILRKPASVAPNVFFRANGDLVTTFNNGDNFAGWYWDGHETLADPNSPDDDVWEACPFDSGTEEDCNRDVNGNFIGGSVSDVWLKVRNVSSFTLGGGATPFEFLYADRTATAIDFWISPDVQNPDPANHILISKEYFNTNYFGFISYTQDNEFKDSFTLQTSGTPTFDAGDAVEIGLRYYPVLPRWALTNGWHDTLMMVYSPEYRPDGDGVCTPEDGDTATGATDDCIVVANLGGFGGFSNNIISLLVLAGENDLLDGDDLNGDLDYLDFNELPPNNDFSDDLYDVFEFENYSGIGPYPVPYNDPDPVSDTGLGLVFDKREDVVTGKNADVLLVIDQQ